MPLKYGGFHKILLTFVNHKIWLVYRENLNLKWMMTGGTPISDPTEMGGSINRGTPSYHPF